MSNLVTVNFIACGNLPSKGYNVQWRVLGSGDPLTDAGNFFVSPAVFADAINPVGTQYEGTITAMGNNTDCTPVNWNTFTEESGSSSGGGFDNSSCGTSISINTPELTFVALPLIDLNVDGATTVNLSYDVLGRPNRFTLYDNGGFADTTGWHGFAPYAGPWGMSLNNSLTGVMSFNPIPGHTYQLLVEVGPAGAPPYDVSDNFNVDVICI